MDTEPYKVSDRVLFRGPRHPDYPMPGKTGIVIEIREGGDAVVQFETDRVVVAKGDTRFSKVS